jgi:hypothetical protein
MFHIFEQRLELAILALQQSLAVKGKSLQRRLDLIDFFIQNKQFDEAEAYLQETRAQLNPIKAYLYEKDLSFFDLHIPSMRELHEMGLQIKEK